MLYIGILLVLMVPAVILQPHILGKSFKAQTFGLALFVLGLLWACGGLLILLPDVPEVCAAHEEPEKCYHERAICVPSNWWLNMRDRVCEVQGED